MWGDGGLLSFTQHSQTLGERKHQESGIEVNYREQAGYTVVTDKAASQQLLAVLHLPAYEPV